MTLPMLETIVLKGCGNEEIDTFCLRNPSSLIHGSSDYIHLVSAETVSEPYWIVVRERDSIRSALPLLVKTGALGTVVNSLAYYGSNGGIITQGQELDAKLAALKGYLDFCNAIGAASSTLITNPLFADRGFYEQYLPHDLRDERIGQFTFFPEDRSPASLMRVFSDPRPRNIRKAQRENIVVHAERSQKALSFLHATHHQNLSLIGGIPKREAFFNAIQECLPESSWQVFIASQAGEWVAALLLLYFNRTVEYFTPCIVERYRSSQALSLIIYEAMLDAMSRDFAQWNWGGTWLSQNSLYSFKKKWGSSDLPYYYYTRLYDLSLMRASRAQLLAEYPGFFVLPFSALSVEDATQEVT
jgi:hypothetical protein